MTTFKAPHAHDDIELESSTHFYVREVSEICSDSDARAYIKEVKDALVGKDGSFIHITEQYTFDVAYSLSLCAKRISPENFHAFTGVLSMAFSRLRDAISSTELSNTLTRQEVSPASANAFKMFTFLLSMNAKLGLAAIKKESTHTKSVASKRSKKLEFAKKPEVRAVSAIMESLLAAARFNFKRFWQMGVPEEDFLSLFTKPALSVFETESFMQKTDLTCRASAVQICVQVATDFPSIVGGNMSVALQQLIASQSHSVPAVAEVVVALQETASQRGQKSDLPSAVLGEALGLVDLRSSKDTTAVRSVAAFLEVLAASAPRFVHANRMVVLPLLNCKCYSLRNSVITALGDICSLCKAEEDDRRSSTDSTTEENGDDKVVDKESRNLLLDLLLERVHDVSAFCRSRCLKTWIGLCEGGAIPRAKLLPVVLAASDRLADKSAMVRKNALGFLEKVFEYCPFQEDEINSKLYTQQMEVAQQKLDAMIEEFKQERLANREAATTAEELLEQDEEDSAMDGEFAAESCGDEDIKKQALIVSYYGDYTTFAHEIENVVMPRMCELLGSKNDSDVVGVLHFFRSIHSRRVKGVTAGIRKMLPLILASENVQKEVLSLFHFLFLEGKSAQQAALNLVECCAGITLSDYAALSMVMHRLVKDKRVPMAVFDSLRKFACFKLPDHKKTPSAMKALTRRQRYSLCLLAMATEVVPDKILGNASHVSQLGASIFPSGDSLEQVDIVKAQFAFRMLQHVPEGQRDSTPVASLIAQAYRFLSWKDNAITEQSELEWYAAAEWAVNAIFSVAKRPVAEFGAFMRAQAESVLSDSVEGVSSAKLSHFLFMLGQFSIKIVVLAEELVAEVKRKRIEFQKRPKEKVAGATDEDEQRKIEEEMGLNAAQEKPEDEVLQKLQDAGIVASNTFIGAFAPVVVDIVLNKDGAFSSDARLRETAVLCLCKMMCISRKFCVDHLQVVFTVLSRSELPTVRSNIAVALGDIAFRFPLEFDPWKKHLYARLEDEHTTVRKNALMVLSHLLLNDMIKLTGFAHMLAKCLEDPEPRIADFAKLFFSEFHGKGDNNMYNILVDTLSCLTQDPAISPAAFQRMAKYLCGFVTRDWQIASVVRRYACSYDVPAVQV